MDISGARIGSGGTGTATGANWTAAAPEVSAEATVPPSMPPAANSPPTRRSAANLLPNLLPNPPAAVEPVRTCKPAKTWMVCDSAGQARAWPDVEEGRKVTDGNPFARPHTDAAGMRSLR
jgi:hypothetical protein